MGGELGYWQSFGLLWISLVVIEANVLTISIVKLWYAAVPQASSAERSAPFFLDKVIYERAQWAEDEEIFLIEIGLRRNSSRFS